MDSPMHCSICGRALNQAEDPLSNDCGGDCWGCIGAIEANMGYQPSIDSVMREIAAGIRPASDYSQDEA